MHTLNSIVAGVSFETWRRRPAPGREENTEMKQIVTSPTGITTSATHQYKLHRTIVAVTGRKPQGF